MRKFRLGVVALAVVALTAGGAGGALAKGKPGGGSSAVSLKFWRNDGTTTSTGFTPGTSADGDRKAVTVDGGSPGSAADAISAISFENWWGQSLTAVQSLKISTQLPLAGGSPRISVLLGDATGASDGHTLFLDPNYCNSENANGWRTSNWRGGVSCTIWDEAGNSYTGVPSSTDGSGVTTPARSAWDVMAASPEHAGETVYDADVVQDQPIQSRVDRITLDSQVFSK